jgi:hypothetical protein
MAAGLGTELFTLSSSFDPYGAYREGNMASQKYDIEQQKLNIQQQAMKEAQAELTPQPPATQPLANMAKSTLPPGFELQTKDGTPTSSGLYNQQIINSQQDLTASQQMMKQATMARAMGDDKSYANLVSEARRLQTTATQNMGNAKKEYQKSIDDGLESLYFSKPEQYKTNLKDALERTGIPLPPGTPENWSPDVKNMLLSKMSPETRARVAKEERAREDQIIQRDQNKRAEERFTAALQGNLGKEYKDVKGQVVGLRNYIPESEIKKLGAKEVPAVSSKLEAAELTDELATLVQQNPASAGLVASFYKNFDKFLPSRYDSMDAGAATELINKEADKLEKSGAPKDEVAAARLIAKKAVDVINARALAASGGGRVLVSELRLQKDVLGLEGLSPKSAVTVYRGLAESDRKATKRYGIDPATIKRPEIPEEKPAEKKPVAQSVTTREQFDALPSGTVYLGKDGKKYRKP